MFRSGAAGSQLPAGDILKRSFRFFVYISYGQNCLDDTILHHLTTLFKKDRGDRLMCLSTAVACHIYILFPDFFLINFAFFSFRIPGKKSKLDIVSKKSFKFRKSFTIIF